MSIPTLLASSWRPEIATYNVGGKGAGGLEEQLTGWCRGTDILLLEKARQMLAHASTRMTQLYDPREDRVTFDEVMKINIRG